MFTKSEKKIVRYVMCTLIVFLILLLSSIWFTTWISLRNQNMEMLERYIGLYSLEVQPGQQPPQPPEDSSGKPAQDSSLFQLSSFYSAAISEEGEVLAVDTGEQELYTEEEIIQTARKIRESQKTSGKIGHMMFLSSQKDGYVITAFVDLTLNENNMNKILFTMFAAGGISIVLLYFAARYFAARIIQPLAENDRRQKQFISDAGHELKTPLSVISADTEILERENGNSRWLSDIRYETEQMSDLIKEMLDLSKAEEGSLKKETADLSRLIEQEVLPFEGIAYEHGLTIHTDITPGITAEADPSAIRHLVSILVDNAVRHCDSGGAINIDFRKSRRMAVLSVANPSAAIETEKLDRLFDRFYRMDEARSADGHYGLGLSIARAIMQAHGGTIRAEYQNGKIIFTAEIPL